MVRTFIDVTLSLGARRFRQIELNLSAFHGHARSLSVREQPMCRGISRQIVRFLCRSVFSMRETHREWGLFRSRHQRSTLCEFGHRPVVKKSRTVGSRDKARERSAGWAIHGCGMTLAIGWRYAVSAHRHRSSISGIHMREYINLSL